MEELWENQCICNTFYFQIWCLPGWGSRYISRPCLQSLYGGTAAGTTKNVILYISIDLPIMIAWFTNVQTTLNYFLHQANSKLYATQCTKDTFKIIIPVDMIRTKGSKKDNGMNMSKLLLLKGRDQAGHIRKQSQ